jgi:3-deoxy-D-manno-octulosonic-acid transferase
MRFIYSFLIYPLFLIIIHIAALFSKAVRKALIPRYHILAIIREWAKQYKNEEPLVLIHTSSMGEFEHVKFLLKKLKENDVQIVITFFSPSGYEHVKSHPDVDLIIYTPFDFQFVWKKIYKILTPAFIVFAKHETWPNYVWTANKLKIPVFIINAALPSESSRFEPLIRLLYRPIYRSLTTIYAVSEKHLQNFNKYYPGCHTEFMGDSKFDQVANRKLSAAKKEYLPQQWLNNSFIIVLGSVHTEDTKIIFPALNKLMQRHNNVKLIIAPHFLHKNYLDEIGRYFEEMGVLFYSISDNPLDQRVIIIDKMGILADLYKYGNAAFIGGSFKQGIHNVMEAAIYGIPVVHGPKHRIAHEAGILNNHGGSIIINSTDEAYDIFSKLYDDKTLREKIGGKAEEFALQNTGTAEKLIKSWQKYL